MSESLLAGNIGIILLLLSSFLLALDIVPIRVVTVMTNAKPVCVLLAFLVPMLVLVMRPLRIKLLMTR